jgi:hypothetical protein
VKAGPFKGERKKEKHGSIGNQGSAMEFCMEVCMARNPSIDI